MVSPEASEIRMIESTMGRCSAQHTSLGSVANVLAKGAPALIHGELQSYESTYQVTISDKRPMPPKPREGKMVFDESTVIGGYLPARQNQPEKIKSRNPLIEDMGGTNKVRDARVGRHMATLTTQKW